MQRDDYFITLRSRDLSLWLSTVQSVVNKLQPNQGKRLNQDYILNHYLMKAARIHAVTEFEGKEILPPGPPSTDGTLTLDEQVYLSKLHYDRAKATLRGDTEAVAELTSEVRKYSKSDISGWASCETTYIAYYTIYGGQPIYRNWRTNGNGNINYGVIERKLPNNARVGIIGDWGTGMRDAKALVKQMISQMIGPDPANPHPAVVIHVGDIYYSGTPDECTSHVKVLFEEVFNELQMAPIPVFTIPGNHDYYAMGAGFYPLIDELNAGLVGSQQQASYFCLRTEDNSWQFLAMDTGYYDSNPANQYDPFYAGPKLHDDEITWLVDKLNNFSGNTVMMSHHQLFSSHSAINGMYTGLPVYYNTYLYSAFEPHFNRISAWVWGHEHNYVLYQDGTMGLNKGRLVGCSGYEAELSEDPYTVNYPEIPYANGMTRLSVVDGFYNHACAIIDLQRNNATDPIPITYYQFPTWGQNDPDPNPLPPLSFLNSEMLSAPVIFNNYTWVGNKKISDLSSIDPKSNYNPGAATLNGKMYIVYKGESSDNLYQATLNGTSWSGNKKISDTYSIDPKSNRSPAMATYKNQIIMVYKGASSNNLYWAQFNGSSWSGNKKISDTSKIDPKSNATPALAVYNNKLYMVYKGESSNNLYVAEFDGSTWSGNRKISDISNIDPKSNQTPGLGVHKDKLYLIYKGESSNDLYQATFDGTTWTGNVKIKDISQISPESNYGPALAPINNRLIMVYKGAHTNNIYQADMLDTTWTGNIRIEDESSIDPRSNYTPALTPYDNRLEMIYKGETTNNIYEAKYVPGDTVTAAAKEEPQAVEEIPNIPEAKLIVTMPKTEVLVRNGGKRTKA